MTPWSTDPNLPARDRRVIALRRLGDRRRAGLKAAGDALAAIEPLARELVAAGEKKRVVAELAGISRPQLDKILSGD